VTPERKARHKEKTMLGSMMQMPLLISSLLMHAERHHPEQEIVSRRVEGDLHRTTYRELAGRARRMANALTARGLKMSDRIGTLAWNGYRHLELYYAVSEWPEFDENTASSLCYTSGTTGNPKGVLYSHRSTVLHAYGSSLPDASAPRRATASCRWCRCSTSMPGACPMPAPLTGAKLVMPGPHLDGASLYSLFEEEGVTMSAGVPTIWLGLLHTCRPTSSSCHRQAPGHRRLGGAAGHDPRLRRTLRHHRAARLGHDRDEPAGHGQHLQAQAPGAAAEERDRIRLKQGRSIFGVDMKIVDGDGRELPRDGKAFGDLLVRGRGSPAATSRARAAIRCATAGSPPATSPPSTPTATCRSPTAPRT
jgi:acyl-CoA synthetase (AMP-forming)/AMP-acid ligase II